MSPPVRPNSFLGGISADALAGLTEFASKFTAPTAFFGAIFIPSPNGGTRSAGTLPGASSINYSVDHDTGALDLSSVDADGRTTTIRAQLRDGTYVDVSTGTPLGLDLDGTLYIDHDAATKALEGADGQPPASADSPTRSKNDEPKLCPDPSLDKPGAMNRADSVEYAQYVRGTIINPQRQPPLEPEMAFALFSPVAGMLVNFDDCQDSTGMMVEIKGNYAWMFRSKRLTENITEEFLWQAEREVSANDLRNAQTGLDTPVEWHFREKRVADFAWNLFENAKLLPQIRICYTPFDAGISYCYPDSK